MLQFYAARFSTVELNNTFYFFKHEDEPPTGALKMVEIIKEVMKLQSDIVT